MMSTMELESEFARISAGVLPASAVPKSIIDQTELVVWDHEKHLGMIWRIPDSSNPDEGYQNMAMIEGLSVREHEKVVILLEERPRAIIPNGDWLMKRDADIRKETGQKDQKLEMIWVDMREFETSRKILGLRSEGRKKADFGCALHFKIDDPGVLVRNLILDENISGGKELDQKIYDTIEEIATSEIAKLEDTSPTLMVQSVKETLEKRMGDWGMDVVSIKLDCIPEPRKEIPLPPPREPLPAINAQRQPLRALMAKAILKREQQVPSNKASLNTEWETISKRWVPLARKGQVKCDGCGSEVDLYVDCTVACRSGSKCKLCKECFPKRKLCAFS